MHEDEMRPGGATYWAVDTTADRAVAERVAGSPVAGAAAQEGLLRVLTLPDADGEVTTLHFVRVARTLRDALEDARHQPSPERLGLLETFARLSETLGRAHEAGITHGTLHAGAVALTDRGHLVVREWELASFSDAETPEETTWEAYLAPYRETPDLRVVPGALDALAYLPPETLRGQTAERDQAADVYALGAILYRILSGFVPYAFQTLEELATKAEVGGLPRASHLDRAAPGPLSALAAQCLAPDPAERPADGDEVAKAVRTWLATRRETETASAERDQISLLIAGVREFGGDAAPRRLDEAIVRCRKLLKRRPSDADAERLRSEAEGMREAIRQADRERQQRAQTEMERAWADATEARAALVRTEAETEKAVKDAGLAQNRLAGVRDDLTRARAELAQAAKRMERIPQENARAMAKAVAYERDRRRKLVILVSLLGAAVALLALAAILFASRRGEARSEHVDLRDPGARGAHAQITIRSESPRKWGGLRA